MARIYVTPAPVSGNVKLSVAVMHAPWNAERRAWVTDLQRGLGAPLYPNLERFELVKAEKGRGIWHTARRAWQAAYRAPKATHHLVLQDDVQLCPKFIEAVCMVTALKPESPLSFYANRKVCEAAREKGVHWVTTPGAWGQALLLPTPLISKWLTWCAEHVSADCPHDDARLVLWSLWRNEPILHPVPSLVEHLGAGRSLVGHITKTPQAARWFVGSDDPTRVDWKAGIASPLNGGTVTYEQYRDSFPAGHIL